MTPDLFVSQTVSNLLWDYESLSPTEFHSRLDALPRKIVRWLAANHPDNRARKWCLRHTGVIVGRSAVINMGIVIVDSFEQLVSIDERASLAPNVTIIADAHPNSSLIRDIPYVGEHLIGRGRVLIGADCWIGAGAILLPGVTIGPLSVVGAGAVVNTDVEPRSIVAGVPARLIRDLRHHA